jgi:hypothetical protein
VYVPAAGDGWAAALLGFVVGEGGRLLVPGATDERSGGRGLHLRPQGGAAASAVAVTAALGSSALQAAGVSSDAGSGSTRTIALLLVLVAGITLAVLAIREWRGGAGGRSLAQVWQQVWDRRPGAGRSGT